MKKNFFITCSLLTLSLFADEDNWSLNDGFAIWGDVAFYRRNEGNNHRLIIDEGSGKKGACGSCTFDSCKSKHLVSSFHYQPGFQVGMVYMTRHSLLEAKYLFVQEWSASCHRNDPGLLYFSASNPYYAEDFFAADKAWAHYKSQFQNAEANYFYYITPRRGDYFSGGWLAGIRYMSLTEHLAITFRKGSNESPYRVHTWNHIPALQVGGTLGWNPSKVLSWDVNAKLGIGFDCSRQRTYWGDVNNTVVLRDYQVSRFSLPLVVGAALSLTYQPWRFINLHGAYEMIYLNGIALAPDQLNKSSSKEHHVRSFGQALIHGATLGITFTF
jgi:hypothetical protein